MGKLEVRIARSVINWQFLYGVVSVSLGGSQGMRFRVEVET